MSQGMPICSTCLFRESGFCDVCEEGDQYEEDFDAEPDDGDNEGFGFSRGGRVLILEAA